ncbi:biotin/lipoyl-containing protein [Herbivorax sp. ANBcel31]|uniref:biotin/lipoyl-containing protein n=1 Tax=Herbivorax sp. ANBcel31 TaxID=3069754 RepID=UPI0027B7A7B1|nr:biotin/lipoyl-containing protein [Herbivorax sp. ANBcel31]MDQ2085780.1 biotin/lipoyl-containing protein [Herbivorax sp. ANBcel31]
MKKFLIKVNGNQYEVEVEEVKDGASSEPAVTLNDSAPAPKVDAPKKSAGGAGSVKVNAPMPGTILSVKVNPGDSIKKGQVLMVLEAMKMENEIQSPQDGTVASVDVSDGASVNSGDVLLTLN